MNIHCVLLPWNGIEVSKVCWKRPDCLLLLPHFHKERIRQFLMKTFTKNAPLWNSSDFSQQLNVFYLRVRFLFANGTHNLKIEFCWFHLGAWFVLGIFTPRHLRISCKGTWNCDKLLQDGDLRLCIRIYGAFMLAIYIHSSVIYTNCVVFDEIDVSGIPSGNILCWGDYLFRRMWRATLIVEEKM